MSYGILIIFKDRDMRFTSSYAHIWQTLLQMQTFSKRKNHIHLNCLIINNQKPFYSLFYTGYQNTASCQESQIWTQHWFFGKTFLSYL
jgi:hypothetical protein